MELPKEFKGTIYFYYWTKHDLTLISQGKSSDPEYILLGSMDIETKFNTSHEYAVKQMVNSLKQQKQNIQADTQKQLNQIDDQINSLLAISHDKE